MGREQIAEDKTVEILHAAVEAFRKREIGYRDMLEDLPAPIYTVDSDGRITYFNDACRDFAGRAPLLGEDRWCVAWKLYTTSGEPLPHDECPTAVAVRDGRPMRGAEGVAERPDGSRVDFAAFPTPILDEQGQCLGAVTMLVDVSEQKQAQERLELLAREVDHRSRNLLAVVQSLIRLTNAGSVDEYKAILEGRLMAIARANSLVAMARWTDITLRSLVEEELAAFRSHVQIDGAAIELEPATAQSIGMVVHELATNAIKHGSLSASDGLVKVTWSRSGDDLGFSWEESGGPPVDEPSGSSTGNAVIAAAARQLNARITRDWRRRGLCFTLRWKAQRPKL